MDFVFHHLVSFPEGADKVPYYLFHPIIIKGFKDRECDLTTIRLHSNMLYASSLNHGVVRCSIF